MRLVVDANVLIGSLFRAAGQQVLEHPALDLFAAEEVWAELRHELPRRAARFAASRGIEPAAMEALVARALAAAERTVLVLPAEAYAPREADARLRCDRDPADWPTVATALVVGGAIWTEDRDFFGCGLATWRSAILRAVVR
jgi:predicted nucleic acid-binding protein